MPNMQRRRLLQLVAGGSVAGFRRWSDRTRGDSDGESAGGSTGPEGFDPAVHGFGFANWEGDTGVSGEGEEFTYEPAEVAQEDVSQAIDDSWTAVFSEAQEIIMTRIVYSWIGGNAATNGHCYGMSIVADGYYQTPADLPAGVDSASEISRPTGEFNAVGDRIRRVQTSQLLRAEPYWFALLGLRWGLADHGESLTLLTEAIDERGTAGIAIDGEANPHQVLAHGYERTEDATNVFIYDPTYEAADHADREDIWKLSVDPDTGDVLDIEDGYADFIYHEPGMDASLLDNLIGGPGRVLDELSNAVFLGLETGGTLSVNVPEGVFVDRPDAEYADEERAPYDDAVLILGSVDEFEVSIDGEVGGEYTFEVLGLRDGDLVLEEVVSDTLEEPTVRLLLAVDEARVFVIEAIEGAAEDAVEGIEDAAEGAEGVADGAGEAAEDVQGAGEGAGDAAEDAIGTPEEGSDDTEEGAGWLTDSWLIAAAGGVLALGLGAAYRLLGRSDDGAE